MKITIYNCPICGKGRGSNQASHVKCSKVMQQRNKELNEAREARKRGKEFNSKGMEIFLNHVANNKE